MKCFFHFLKEKLHHFEINPCFIYTGFLLIPTLVVSPLFFLSFAIYKIMFILAIFKVSGAIPPNMFESDSGFQEAEEGFGWPMHQKVYIPHHCH